MEMQATSGQFNADMFAMANAVDFAAKEGYEVPFTVACTVDAEKHTAVFNAPEDVTASITIPGLTKAAEAPTTGQFSAKAAPGSAGQDITVTFNADFAQPEVEISYKIVKSANVIEITNQTSAVGELVAKWPVYATGDETDAAGVKGYVLMKVYKCRVTAMPGFDTSYKSAAQNSVTFSAMDAKRADESIYNIAYVEK